MTNTTPPAAAPEDTDLPDIAAPAPTKKNAVNFLRFALAQRNKSYVMNHPLDLGAKDPPSFDCSGLVTWAAVQCGYPVRWPNKGDWSFSQTQIDICREGGTMLPVDEALKTAGALLFRSRTANRVGHIAISLGNGSVMHAMSPVNGVNVSTAASDYHFGGFLPEMAFPGPISGLPSGRLGQGPAKTGGGFKGASGGTETPIGSIADTLVEIVVGQAVGVFAEFVEVVTDKEDDNMLFLARERTNTNLWMRGNGVQSVRIRAAHLDEFIELLKDPHRGPVYHNPLESGCPAITDVDDVPLLTLDQIVAHLGVEMQESIPS